MTKRIRRGLGLLVVAVLAGIVGVFAYPAISGGGAAVQLVWTVAFLAVATCVVVGLALIAWDLLRSDA